MSEKTSSKELLQKIRNLEEDLEFYHSLVDNSPDLLYRSDLNGRILSISPSVFDLSGYTVEEAIGMNMAEEVYVDPNERQNFMKELQEKGEVKNFVVQLKRKNGSTWWASTNAHFYKDHSENNLGVEGISRDITELKRKENALRESENRFRLAFHTNSDSINLNRVSDGMYIDINEGFTELTGYEREDVIGKTSLSINIWNDAADREHLIEGLLKTGRVDNMEAQFVKKSGEVSDGLISARILKIHNEDVIQSVTKEITETKQLQKHLLQNQKLEAIGTLAGGIAHDFNNMLGGIFGYAQLILINSKENPKVENYANKIFTAGERAKRLVQQILDFSRQGNLEKSQTDISIIINEVLKLIGASLPSSIEIRQNIRSGLGSVLANPEQIHQVVMNLCINASHAMQKNGGQLDVELNYAKIGIDAVSKFQNLCPEKYLMLTIADTGHGMDNGTISRIFEPFFSTKEKGEGTGMGLATVHGIVKNHGGEVKVFSELGVGTTFQVLLPLTEEYAEESPSLPKSLPKGTESILLVDDEEFLIEVGKDMLEKLGYKAETRSSPLEALNTFQKNPDDYDLIITDLTMPKMTGDKFAKEIKKIRQDIPIILCTGLCPESDVDQSRETGINCVLVKPLTIQELAETVRKVLDN